MTAKMITTRVTPALWNRTQVCTYLGISPASLDRWADRDAGPPFVRVGPNRIRRYPVAELEKWVSEQERGGGEPISAEGA